MAAAWIEQDWVGITLVLWVEIGSINLIDDQASRSLARIVGITAIDGLTLDPGQWRLVVRDDGSPFGWIDADGVATHRDGGELYDSVTAGGSLFTPDGTLRAALDAALSSPSGIGVAVDESGAIVGGVSADEVIEALAAQRRAEPD